MYQVMKRRRSIQIILYIVVIVEHEKVRSNIFFNKIFNIIISNVRFLNGFTKCKCVLKN